jgi:Protein of unknown function DUF262
MEDKTYLVLAQYREGSEYQDQIGKLYHFPKKYFNQLTVPAAEFIYFEPKKSGKGEYFGYGQIGRVYPDAQNDDQFFAEILDYRPFPNAVPSSDDSGQSREFGPFYNPQNAVRKTSTDIFAAICGDGGIDLTSLGTESEGLESDEAIVDPFEPSKIKVDREPMSVFQVLRKLSLGEILLNPDFQRNLVWDPVRRSRLIESLLLRIPLPAFYFDGVDANKWAVVDGLQRLSTIQDFVTKKDFALHGLEYLSSAEGMHFDELPRGMQRDIEETQVMLFIIRPDTPPEVKFTIFYRINTGGLVLTAQEIRHALFQGQATQLLRELAQSDEFIQATEGGVSDIRMDARECILRYLAFRMNPYTSYSKSDLNSFLSTTMKDLNGLPKTEIAKLAADFREAMIRAFRVFGRYAFRKFSLGARRGPVNKALFESWANVLQKYDFDELLLHEQDILVRVSEMFASDSDYSRSLSAGTGSIRSVYTRFVRADESLREILK